VSAVATAVAEEFAAAFDSDLLDGSDERYAGADSRQHREVAHAC
jgi:hypothetical protein